MMNTYLESPASIEERLIQRRASGIVGDPTSPRSDVLVALENADQQLEDLLRTVGFTAESLQQGYHCDLLTGPGNAGRSLEALLWTPGFLADCQYEGGQDDLLEEVREITNQEGKNNNKKGKQERKGKE